MLGNSTTVNFAAGYEWLMKMIVELAKYSACIGTCTAPIVVLNALSECTENRSLCKLMLQSPTKGLVHYMKVAKIISTK